MHHLFFISLSTIMSFWPGVCRIWLLVWLLPFDWWPGIEDPGGGAETLNIDV
jgi:hypothetical protein